MNNSPLALGIDSILKKPNQFKSKKIALVCNEASVTSTGKASRLALIEKGFEIVKLFSPEHGLESIGEDGRYIPNGKDRLTNLPIVSLYGDKLMPSEADLINIDLVLIDLPDIGCRFYTYLWTLTYVMEACEKHKIPVLIADRPNPISGNLNHAEGPFLDEESCSSFIGRWAIPLKHACSLGELASYFKQIKLPALNLEIEKLKGWNRNNEDVFDFNPTSPAMQSRATAYLYPGSGLLEGINVNEGRGTENPFKQFGAPWINANELYTAFAALNIPYLNFKALSYIPSSGLYANQECHGLKFSINDNILFKPVAFGIALISVLMKLYPNNMEERLYDTVANPSGKAHLDKLLGIKNAFEQLKKGNFYLKNISDEWKEILKNNLLY